MVSEGISRPDIGKYSVFYLEKFLLVSLSRKGRTMFYLDLVIFAVYLSADVVLVFSSFTKLESLLLGDQNGLARSDQVF